MDQTGARPSYKFLGSMQRLLARGLVDVGDYRSESVRTEDYSHHRYVDL